MPGESSPPSGSRGLVGELLSLWGSFGRHIQALIELAGLEGKEAAALYLRLAVMLGAAVLFLFLGYVFALLFIVFALNALFGFPWIWVVLALAVLHFAVCLICATHVKNHLRSPVFPATAAELRKDFETLKAVRK
jgi:uncharacterized membrane protein YqjE